MIIIIFRPIAAYQWSTEPAADGKMTQRPSTIVVVVIGRRIRVPQDTIIIAYAGSSCVCVCMWTRILYYIGAKIQIFSSFFQTVISSPSVNRRSRRSYTNPNNRIKTAGINYSKLLGNYYACFVNCAVYKITISAKVV